MARTRQPQGPARIDWSNPLARNLRFFVTCSGTPFEHVRGVQAIAANAATTAVGADGVALRCSPAGTKYWYVPYHSSYALTGACSVSSHVRTGAAPGTFSAIASMAAYNGATDTPFDSYLFISYFQAGRANAGGYRNFYLTVSTIAANTDYRVGWICSTSNVEDAPLLLCNGTSGTGILNTGSGSGAVTDSGSNLLIGTRGDNTTLLDGDSYYIAGWGADIGLEGLKEIHRNPWQLLAPQRRLWIQLGAANDALDTAAGAVVTATASAIAGAATGSSAVNATATGATVVASASTIAGALTAASAATAATVAASASAIAGAATSSSQAAAATVTATASAISGAATGAGQSAAATVAATASATGGAATAASATTAATITASSSAIAGAASGTAAATATGATVVADASIIAGSATGNAAGTATGATVAADASAIAGSSSASAAATGQTAAVTASATAGSAQSDHAAAGAVVSASTTAIPGAIAVGAGATTLGATVAATVTYQSGAVAAASSAAGWAQVVTAIAARGVAYGALPDIDPRYLVPSRKRRFTVQARGRRFNART